MSRLIVARCDGLRCAAIADGTGVTDLYVAQDAKQELAGAVVQAVVTRNLPGQGAAIVRFGAQEGYWNDAAAKNAKSGDTVRLQIKAEMPDGKLPQLARDIALPGRFLIHLPDGKGIKNSRRATSAPPDCLDGLPGGWVLRRHAGAADAAQLAHEAHALLTLGRQPEIPALTVWQRAVIEHGVMLTQLFAEDASLLAAMRLWLTRFAPDLLPGLRQDGAALDWDSVLADAGAPQVALPDGGMLTIEQTRALCAVDVDAGAGQNHLQTNLHAVQALARQLRLRNIGGVIVVDFINLPQQAARAKLIASLRRAVADDPAGVTVFGLTHLGLAELTRSRRGPSLASLRV